jgi:hypothetical protein
MKEKDREVTCIVQCYTARGEVNDVNRAQSYVPGSRPQEANTISLLGQCLLMSAPYTSWKEYNYGFDSYQLRVTGSLLPNTSESFPEKKYTKPNAEHSPPSSALVKSEWSFTSTAYVCLRIAALKTKN